MVGFEVWCGERFFGGRDELDMKRRERVHTYNRPWWTDSLHVRVRIVTA